MRRVALGGLEDVSVGEVLGSGLALPVPSIGKQDVEHGELRETTAVVVGRLFGKRRRSDRDNDRPSPVPIRQPVGFNFHRILTF